MSSATQAVAHVIPARSSLARNVTAMYALQIANYVIPLATLPYLIRVLGAANYGKLAIAYAVVYFMVLFVDAGFNSLASRSLARPGIGLSRISAIFSATQWIKFAQCVAMFVLLCLLIACVPFINGEAAIYLASFPIVIGSLLFPTWLFQGLEIMHFTTLCSVGGRLIATLGIFVFVRDSGDVVTAAALQGSATILSGLLALPIIFGHLGLRLRFPGPRFLPRLRRTLTQARALAPAEFATHAIGASGVIILGLFSSAAVVGTYAAIEKVARSAAGLFQPLTKSLFPRIAGLWIAGSVDAASDCRLWTWRLGGLALTAATAIYMLAPFVLELLFGAGWHEQALLLRLFSVWLVASVTATAVGDFWLLARGRRTAYSHCLIAAAMVQLALSIVATMKFGAEGLIFALAAAELVRLVLVTVARRL